jgi:hydrogenase maturation protease
LNSAANHEKRRKLLLACGNALRSDDGVGAEIAAEIAQDTACADMKIVVVQQFTPELAEMIANSDLVAFVDAAVNIPAGEISMRSAHPETEEPGSFTHHLSPAALLALSETLYGKLPARAITLTVGALSFELGESLTKPVRAAVPVVVGKLRRFFSD